MIHQRLTQQVLKSVQTYSFSTCKTAEKTKPLTYALVGMCAFGVVSALYDHYQSQLVRDKEKNEDVFSSADLLRKQKVTASVYHTMGVGLLPHQVHISYDDNVIKPSFSHGFFSNNLSIKLPKEMKDRGANAETELVATVAKQAAHDKEHHRLLETMISGGTAGIMYAMMRSAGYYPRALMCISYPLMLSYLHCNLDHRSDRVAVKYFPDYAQDMVDVMRKSQENSHQLTDYDQHRAENILQSRQNDNEAYNRAYPKILRWISLHRRRFDSVKPNAKYPHPLMRAYKEKGLHLNAEQCMALNRLSRSARVYVPEEMEPSLQAFFDAHKKQNTPLGQLYRTMSFSDFIERLITKTYKAIYLDGRLLRGRHHHEARLMKALPLYPQAAIADNLDLLIKVGSPYDAEEVFYDYLTLEEIGMRSLLIEQAVCLPIGDGRRDTIYLETSQSDTDFQLPVIKSLAAARRQPVVVAAVSGIEARNGQTVHPDLFMIFVPKVPNQRWTEMTLTLRQSPYYAVSSQIYGEKLAINQAPNTCSEDKDFVLFGGGKYHEEWYICKPAYKNRMKVLYRSLLTTADLQMQAYDLGHSYNLKGLGLGFFGFSAAIPLLEQLSKEALSETLTEIKLKHIQQVNLINWPSQVAQADPEHPLHQQAALKQIDTINTVKVFEGITEAFSIVDSAGLVGGTHACADAASQFGNEAHIGMPPSSSDEAATYYSLLDPTVFLPEENPDLCLRIKHR